MTLVPGNRVRVLASLVVCAVLALPVLAAAKLPTAVAEAFRKAYPKATIKNSLQENVDGKTVYEIESVDNGLRRDLLYTPEGQVIEIEEIVPFDSLPEVVRAAVKREAPAAKVVNAEHIDREGVESYGIIVKEKGKSRELNFDPQGNLLKP